MSTLTPARREGIRATHTADDEGFCAGCWQDLNWPIDYPCQRVLLLDALEAAEAERADAWDEGHRDGYEEAPYDENASSGEYRSLTANPYRSEPS